MIAQRSSLDLSFSQTQIRKHLEQFDPRPQPVSWSWYPLRHSPAGSCSFWSEGWSACARYWRWCRTWAHNLCLESDRPDDQTVHPRAESRTGLVWFQSCRCRSSQSKDRRKRSELRNTQEWHGRGRDDFWETRKGSLKYLGALDELCEVWHVTRKMCACVRTVRCYLYTTRRVHGSCHCLDAKSVREKLHRQRRELELRSTSATVETIFARNKYTWASLNMNLSLSVLSIRPTTVDVAILLVATLSTVENLSSVESSTMLSFSVHVEDEDDEKCYCQLKLNHSKCCRTVGSNVLCCLVLRCNGILRYTFALVSLKADNSICWWFIIFSFQRWSCLRIWIETSHEERALITMSLSIRRFMLDVNFGDVVDVLDLRLRPSDRHLKRYVSSFCHRLSMEVWLPRLLTPLFASTAFAWSICHWLCPCFSLVTELLLYDTTVFQRCKCCSDSVHLILIGSKPDDTQTHVSIPLARVSGKKDTEWSKACLSSINSKLPIS